MPMAVHIYGIFVLYQLGGARRLRLLIVYLWCENYLNETE